MTLPEPFTAACTGCVGIIIDSLFFWTAERAIEFFPCNIENLLISKRD